MAIDAEIIDQPVERRIGPLAASDEVPLGRVCIGVEIRRILENVTRDLGDAVDVERAGISSERHRDVHPLIGGQSRRFHRLFIPPAARRDGEFHPPVVGGGCQEHIAIGIDAKIENALQRTTPLKSGGYLVFDDYNSPQVRRAVNELVQDTLERAWSKLHLYRRGTDLRAWLFTVMHNVHVNKVRSQRATDPLEDEMPELAQRAPQGDSLLVRDLDRAVARLPAEQRAVLLLVTLEEMSYEEVAQTLGIPIGTVMSRLSRARDKLRAMMLGQVAAAKLKVVK